MGSPACTVPRPWLLMSLLPVPRRRKGVFAPLDGLDEIPWADLRHAYGSAADVPGILRGLARPGTDSERADLLDRLNPRVYDQGVCSAGAAAVPFLIELACTPAVPSRAAIVGLIGDFAAWPNEMGEPWRSARDTVRCWDALVAGHDALAGLLQDADGSVRAAAAELMWAYAAWSPRVDGALAALLELDAVEPDIAVRVSLRRDGAQAAIDARESGAASAGPIAAAVERLAGTPRMAPALRLACLAASRRLDPASVTWRELLDAALAPDTPREGFGWSGGGSYLAVMLCRTCGADSAAWLNLIRSLIGHEQAQVRAGALRTAGEAMAQWRSAPAALVPLIGPLLADPEPEIRMMSADLLAAAGQAGAEFDDRLAAVLDDSYPPAAACAAWALARHGDPRAVPVLIRALDEEKSGGFGVSMSMHISDSFYSFSSPSLGEALLAAASRHGPALAPALHRALTRGWPQNGTAGGPPIPLNAGPLDRSHVICQALAACGPVAPVAAAELEALLGSTRPQLALTVIEAAGPAAAPFAPRLERLQRDCLEAAAARLIPSPGLDVTDKALNLRPGQSAPWITALAAAGTCFVLTGDGQALLRTVDEVLALTAPIRHHDAAADGGPNLMYTPAANLAGALARCLSPLGPAAADRMSWPAQWLRANHWRRRSHGAVQALPGWWVSRAAVQVAGALWRTTGDAGLACRVFEHVLNGPPPSGYDPVELDVLRHVADMGSAARPLAPLLRALLDRDERIFTSGWRGIAQDEEARQLLTRALATG